MQSSKKSIWLSVVTASVMVMTVFMQCHYNECNNAEWVLSVNPLFVIMQSDIVLSILLTGKIIKVFVLQCQVTHTKYQSA